MNSEIPKILMCEVYCWKDFYELVDKICSFSNKRYIFRGQAGITWPLSSSYDRAKSRFQYCVTPHAAEYMAIERFKKYSNLKYEKNIEYLSAMQHYGAYTRLVDFTESIFVALYFAFNENPQEENSDENFTHSIWMINLEKIRDGIKELNDQIKKRCDEETSGLDDNSDFSNGAMEAICDDICYEEKYNEYNFIKKCLEIADKLIVNDETHFNEEGVIPIFTLGNNPRIIAQNGLFLFQRTFKTFIENLEATFWERYIG